MLEYNKFDHLGHRSRFRPDRWIPRLLDKLCRLRELPNWRGQQREERAGVHGDIFQESIKINHHLLEDIGMIMKLIKIKYFCPTV